MAKRYIIFRNYLGSVEPNCKKAQLAVTSHQKWLRNPPYYMPHLQDVLIMTWEHSFDGGDTKCSLEPTFCSILFWFYQIPTLVSNKDSVNTWLLNVTHFCVILLKIKLEKEREREREREGERERESVCTTVSQLGGHKFKSWWAFLFSLLPHFQQITSQQPVFTLFHFLAN